MMLALRQKRQKAKFGKSNKRYFYCSDGFHVQNEQTYEHLKINKNVAGTYFRGSCLLTLTYYGLKCSIHTEKVASTCVAAVRVVQHFTPL